jgi:hypothetical protein
MNALLFGICSNNQQYAFVEKYDYILRQFFCGNCLVKSELTFLSINLQNVYVNTLKLSFYISSLYSLLDSVYVFISIAKTSI